jgi:hypothetical protein
MKSKKQKENIREMLRAESLGNAKSSWGDFKRKLSDEFLTTKIPRLELTPTFAKGRGQGVGFRWLVPAFALFLIAGGFMIWHLQQKSLTGSPIVSSVHPGQVTKRAFRKGDVFKLERREIRFLQGNAELTQDGEKIILETASLTADFRLGQKVDMQIRHPLVSVAITGTQFIFTATAKRGNIRLNEGSLAIEYNGPTAKPEKITLKAPAAFTFSERKYEISVLKAAPVPGDKLLYRYDLVNGETFFAHQIRIDAKYHRVGVLGGSEQIIPVENILRVVAAENP